MKSLFSHILYGLIWAFSFMPLWLLYGLSDLFYCILYHIVRYRRGVVRTNLRNSFPEKDEKEIRTIERRFYHHLCDLFVEMYKTWHISPSAIRRRCVFKHTDILQRYFDEGKGVVGVLGHYCNWEWLTSFTLWMKGNVNFYTLYKPIHDPVLDRMMVRIRSHFGAQPIPKKDVLRRITADCRDKKVFLAAFVGDQTPDSGNLNFWMEFLNQDTPILIGTERIATKFDLPVISLHMRKVKRGYYEVDFMNLCEHPSTLSPGELTRMHTRILEQQIRETPEFWLWSHRRWKHKREQPSEIR